MTLHRATINLRKAAERNRFFDELCEAAPHLDRKQAVIELARLAAERNGKETEEPTEPSGIILRCLAHIAPESVQWLWPFRIPLGKLTIVTGDPGLGKSLLTLDIATRISQGWRWPDGDETAEARKRYPSHGRR